MTLTPYYEKNGITIYCGDCLDAMREMPDNCIDTIITDPPYGLQFMGKNWDHGIPGEAYWCEALRVAKPGATLLAFGGARTHHRLMVAIEDAGWEIRDCITYFHDGNQAEVALMASLDDEQLAAYLELHYPNHQMSWVYGSGFPKSYNVSKGIDEAKGAERDIIGDVIRLGDKKAYPKNQDEYNQNCYVLGNTDGPYKGSGYITAPATPLAKQFDGYGTALKPAYEPIILAQKPVDGTYANNAEVWGVAGLNVDGGRIEANGENLNGGETVGSFGRSKGWDRPWKSNPNVLDEKINNAKAKVEKATNLGRYPANIIHDGSEEVEAEFAKAGESKSSGGQSGVKKSGHTYSSNWNEKENRRGCGLGDTGTPSRFFYCAKAPQSERQTPGNNHPTQKPLSLIRYLAKLTRTPTGGLVLDPFAGSGTTAIACIAEKRKVILIEKEPEYAALCRRRIAEYTGQEIAPKEIEVSAKEIVTQPGLW